MGDERNKDLWIQVEKRHIHFHLTAVPGRDMALTSGEILGASYSQGNAPESRDLWDEMNDRRTRVMEAYRRVKCFKGNREEFRGWLNMVIAYKDFFHFTDQEMRLALFSLLDGEAKRWWEKASSNIASFKQACAALNDRYDYVLSSVSLWSKIASYGQRYSQPVADYFVLMTDKFS